MRDDTVQRLDLATGEVRQIARLPGRVVAADLFGDRLYLANPEARALWVLTGPPVLLAASSQLGG